MYVIRLLVLLKEFFDYDILFCPSIYFLGVIFSDFLDESLSSCSYFMQMSVFLGLIDSSTC